MTVPSPVGRYTSTGLSAWGSACQPGSDPLSWMPGARAFQRVLPMPAPRALGSSQGALEEGARLQIKEVALGRRARTKANFAD